MAIIFTTHATDRLKERGISHHQAEDVINRPHKTLDAKNGTKEFRKRFGRYRVTLIGKKTREYDWVVISAWIDPPLPGTKDHQERLEWKTYQKKGFWAKLLYTFKKQIGL